MLLGSLGRTKFRLICFLGCILVCQAIEAQQHHIPTFESQRNKVFAYNVGIGAAIGGIGALINKKPNEKWWKTLAKGAGVGAAGGFINYQAKNATFLITKNEEVGYAWISKLGHSVGASMVENAAMNRDFWASWHISMGPVRFQIDRQNKYRPEVKLLPIALAGTIAAATQGKFDLKYTFASGTPVFVSDSVGGANGGKLGRAFVNSIVIAPATVEDFYGIFAHEYVHTLQYESFLGINHFYPKNKFLNNPKLNWIYWDTYFAVNGFLFLFIDDDIRCKYNSMIEREASHFAFREALPLCK
ncbi:MAG: hypothetical protein DRI69_06180 [Bacteroidetes bacterium]|nr:MAG: hypothetical protein DRI69_06180 [Bacteroidota bacterium]